MKTRKYAVALALIGLVVVCTHARQATPDLSTPESTVIGFTKTAAEGNAKLAQSHSLPGGVDYQDIWEVLTARPGTPRYPARRMLESVDAQRPIVVKSKQETPGNI